MAKIWLNAGHGGNDPGACANGRSEAVQVENLREQLERCFPVLDIPFGIQGMYRHIWIPMFHMKIINQRTSS